LEQQTNILFITPPFTQLNTPYPATAYLKGFFNTLNISTAQVDLGIDVTLKLFSKYGFTEIFHIIESNDLELSANTSRIVSLQSHYIQTIDPVIQFLQGHNPTLAHSIISREFLPESSRFSNLEDLDWAFGELGINDKAKHLATLYLEDMADLIVEAIDPYFGFSRYAEKIAVAASSFNEIHDHLEQEDHLIDRLIIQELEKAIQKSPPKMVAISIPFPGNLYGALKCGQYIKSKYPNIPILPLPWEADIQIQNYAHYLILEYLITPISLR
jgi:hypothetical protein